MSTSEAPAAGAATAINVDDSGADRLKERAPKTRLPVIFSRNKAGAAAGGGGGWKRCVAFFDFLLRLCGIAATLTAAIVMGTTDETLPFFTQLFQFHANYSDLPAMTFFVIANGIVAGYLVLSLLFSIVGIVRPQAAGPRILLLMCDTVMLALLTAAASSATAIVYLAHNGDSAANWVAICLRFDGFCQRISGSVVASFVAVVFFMLLVIMSGLLLRKKH